MGYFRINPAADLGHPPEYYADRDIQIDGRGEIHISPSSNWGVGIMVITASHDPDNFGAVVYRPVVVKDKAWICSGAMLYNCTIGEGAIVAAGCVVRSRDVPDWTMVEGNPARIIARYIDGMWIYASGGKLPSVKDDKGICLS
jgi:acetyltransferase-like isoleucine patch superfamily enzyme